MDPRGVSERGLGHDSPSASSGGHTWGQYFALIRTVYLQGIESNYKPEDLYRFGGILSIAAIDKAGIFRQNEKEERPPSRFRDLADARRFWQYHRDSILDLLRAGLTLQEAVKKYYEDYDGTFPETYEELQSKSDHIAQSDPYRVYASMDRRYVNLEQYFSLSREVYIQGVTSHYSSSLMKKIGFGVLLIAANDAENIRAESKNDKKRQRIFAMQRWQEHETEIRRRIKSGMDTWSAITTYFQEQANSEPDIYADLKVQATQGLNHPGVYGWNEQFEYRKAVYTRAGALPEEAPIGLTVEGVRVWWDPYESDADLARAVDRANMVDAIVGPVADLAPLARRHVSGKEAADRVRATGDDARGVSPGYTQADALSSSIRMPPDIGSSEGTWTQPHVDARGVGPGYTEADALPSSTWMPPSIGSSEGTWTHVPPEVRRIEGSPRMIPEPARPPSELPAPPAQAYADPLSEVAVPRGGATGSPRRSSSTGGRQFGGKPKPRDDRTRAIGSGSRGLREAIDDADRFGSDKSGRNRGREKRQSDGTVRASERDVPAAQPGESGTQFEIRVIRADRPARESMHGPEYYSYEGGQSGSINESLRIFESHFPGLPKVSKSGSHILKESRLKFMERHGILDRWMHEYTRMPEWQQEKASKWLYGKIGELRPDLVEMQPRSLKLGVVDITQKPGDPSHSFKTELYGLVYKELYGWTYVSVNDYKSPLEQKPRDL